MVLLIDAGNTRIKWAISDPHNREQPGTWVQLDSMTHQEFSGQPSPWAEHVIDRAIISNVAGSAIHDQLVSVLQNKVAVVEWFAAQACLAGVTNHYRNPQQLGSDRFATAIAAHAMYPGQDIVVATCGTATTIDAVSAQGDFNGGMIAPGLLLMTQSLAQKTAQLPQVKDAGMMTAHFADNTQAAILSGCLAAQAGAIEYAARNFAGLMRSDGSTSPLLILSGGAAKYIAPSLKLPHQLVDNLVLIGLQAYSLC